MEPVAIVSTCSRERCFIMRWSIRKSDLLVCDDQKRITMKFSVFNFILVSVVAGLVSACGDGNGTRVLPTEAGVTPLTAVGTECSGEGGITYLCRLQSVEDLLSLGTSGHFGIGQ